MKKYADLTYEMLPSSWLFCFLDGCERSEECIRHISASLIPDDRTEGNAVYPTVLKSGSCPHFKAARKIKVAYGFDTIFDEVKRKDDTPLRSRVKEYLGGNGSYYLYKNGKKLLTPEQQQWIIDLFRSYGYTENLRFDHYREVYDLH